MFPNYARFGFFERAFFDAHQSGNKDGKNNMSRKNRATEEQNPTPEQSTQDLPKDSFQEKGERIVESASRLFEGKAKQVRNAVIAIVAVAVIGGVAYVWMNRSDEAGQAALGKAIGISQATIVEIPAPDSTELTFKTEAERDKAALKAFDDVVAKHGGEAAEKARFMAATIRLKTDRKAALDALKVLSDANSETGELARFALAQALVGDGKFDEAIGIYNRIVSSSRGVIPMDKINFEIASTLEKQGKKDEALTKFFAIAKKGQDAKDKDGNPAPLTTSATKAKERVEKLSPEKAKELNQVTTLPVAK
jgi:hypothetical protein